MYDNSQIPLLNRLPRTRIRLMAARVLYGILHILLRNDRYRVYRNGIYYEIDLSEALDLSVFLFGSFQSHVTETDCFPLPQDAIIFDVGANFGSLSLRFAQLAPQGKIYAFEPTDYAFEKLRRNLALNPSLANRIVPIQTFVSDASTKTHHLTAYSSWKVDGRPLNAHPVHGGSIQTADNVGATTIDDFCREQGIERVDLVKIDTDGHEYQVLLGALQTLAKHRPFVIFEIGIYLMSEHGVTFEQYSQCLTSLGYSLLNIKNGKLVTQGNYLKQIPLRATTDILAVPPKK